MGGMLVHEAHAGQCKGINLQRVGGGGNHKSAVQLASSESKPKMRRHGAPAFET